MKKYIILSLAFCSTALFAQKPEQGKVTTEVGMALSSFLPNVNSFGLNGRYFIKSDLALVVGIGMENFGVTENFFENSDGTGATGTFETKTSGNSISLGIQKHFAGTDRLSPFIGLGVGFGGLKATEEGTNSDGSGYVASYTENMEQKGSMTNVSLSFGVDYWFTDGMYIGLTYNPLAWTSMNFKESTTTVVSGGTTVKSVEGGTKISALSMTGSVPFFRVGWRF